MQTRVSLTCQSTRVTVQACGWKMFKCHLSFITQRFCMCLTRTGLKKKLCTANLGGNIKDFRWYGTPTYSSELPIEINNKIKYNFIIPLPPPPQTCNSTAWSDGLECKLIICKICVQIRWAVYIFTFLVKIIFLLGSK